MRAVPRLVSLLVFCTFASGFPQGTGASEAQKEKDVYAIYSLVLTDPQTSYGADRNEWYLIASTTTVRGFPQLSCVRPPEERETVFEAWIDSVRIQTGALDPRPHVLIDPNEAAEFRAERSSPSSRFRLRTCTQSD